MFALDKRLASDTFEVLDLEACKVLLMNDSTLPWLILVPGFEGLTEVHELTPGERELVFSEVALASRVISAVFRPDKVNIGALGNIVPQLHIHVIGRSRGDRAWPGPVWGAHGGKPYSPEEADERAAMLKKAFSEALS